MNKVRKYDPYLNKEELYFSYYLDELIKACLVENYTYEATKYELTPKYSYNYVKITELKTKTKREDKTKVIFQPMTYCPDFIINFTVEGTIISGALDKNKVFITSNSSLTNTTDVKGAFAGKTNSTQYTFPLKQKYMYDKYRIYVQKIVPDTLFQKTFTPDKVILNEVYKVNCRNGKKGGSKLDYLPKSLKQYLKELI